MEILANDPNRVLRYDVEDPCLWWEFTEEPHHVDVVIEQMNADGITTIRLTSAQIEYLAATAHRELAGIKDSWHNPETYCCREPRPREECSSRYVGDTLVWECKVGYGCKADAKVVKIGQP